MGKRRRAATPDNWQQLELLVDFPEQRTYELIRPIVLFGQPLGTRAEETGTPTHTLRRLTARFDAEGMQSLFANPDPSPPHQLPSEIRQLILDLKVEHPLLRVHELATICYVRTGRRPDAKTIKRLLAATALPVRANRCYPPYHQIADPAERRAVIIRLHMEGWTKQSIAEYLETSRTTIHATLRRWVTEGVGGLYNKSRAPRGVRKVTLKIMDTVRRLQRNPFLGEFRVSAALKQQLGIKISPRTCGRILSLNRQLYAELRTQPPSHEKKPMPFQAVRRHQYWSVDIRYLTRKEQQVADIEVAYSVTILDNYSRAILASALTRTQDLSAYLLVLFAAVAHYGAPEGIVSDGGAVFKAKQAQTIYQSLGMEHHTIEPRRAWQNYAETTFNLQRRMADWNFRQATIWGELVAAHEQWMLDVNYQPHWAHRNRDDNRHSPVEVLDWVRGAVFEVEALQKIFHTMRFNRRLDQAGYVHFRRWKIYGEYGLARQRAVIWLTAENLTIAFNDQPLAQYGVTLGTGQKRLLAVRDPQLLETSFRSPQLLLWPIDGDEWRKVVPPRHLEPLDLWEYGDDGVVKIVPHWTSSRHRTSPPNVAQERLRFEI